MAARRRDLLAALRETAPDVVITELFPFGRRKFSYELLPFLTAARDRRRPPLIISSVRDILEPPSDPARRNESIRWANDHFDALLAHGDPDFLTLDVSMSETPCLRLPVLYTGYVAAATSPGGHEEYRTVVPEVLVSAGGGRSGGRLLQSAEGAALLIAGRVRLRWRLVSGPNGERPLHEQSRAYHSGSEIIRERRRDDMPALMAGAALSVSRAGYNTVAEALAAHTRMVLVPDTEGGQREQMLRARHLEERGLARYLTGSALTPENLAEAVLTHLDTPPPLHNVKLDGAAETARLIARLWQQYHAEGGLARHGEAR